MKCHVPVIMPLRLAVPYASIECHDVQVEDTVNVDNPAALDGDQWPLKASCVICDGMSRL
jgi:hypothetical protein